MERERGEQRERGQKKRKFVRKISGPRSEIPPSNGPACCPAVPCWAMGSCSLPARPSDATLGKKNYTKKPRSSLPPSLRWSACHSRGEGDINYLGQRYAKFSHNTKKGTRMGEKDGRFVVLQERCSIQWCMKETREVWKSNLLTLNILHYPPSKI